MTTSIWIITIAGGVITFLLRFSFLGLADRADQVSPQVREALRMIPAAALAALVAPAVLRAGPDGALDLLNPRVVAAGVALLVMWKTRHVVLTLTVGLGLLVGLQQVGWT
ncbi:AzlD domain-containing protein [Euzebya tangerina]|uniref:AzlD domain-containing protein n=1 Tax=Euzebya tangerina TaxID=591198 RepID=UPI000E323A6E|nr:AzlD domain-containing protein [Euzebya tangerina]